jgi:hypothetical protein
MISNAGLMPQALLELLKVVEWEQMINVNIKGVLYGFAAGAAARAKSLSEEVPKAIRSIILPALPSATAAEAHRALFVVAPVTEESCPPRRFVGAAEQPRVGGFTDAGNDGGSQRCRSSAEV